MRAGVRFGIGTTFIGNRLMPTKLESLMGENLLSVFGERDAKKRRGVTDRIRSSDGVFIVPYGAHVGHADLDKAVEQILQKYPD
jgi:hypothetical protein